MSTKKSGENGGSGNGISSSGATAAATAVGATTTTNATTSTITNSTSGSSSSTAPMTNAGNSNGSLSLSVTPQPQNPPQKQTSGGGSVSGVGKSTGSTTASANGESGTNRGRRDRPCDACRRRKSRCVMNEGAEICVLCQFHSQECTFVQSPQPRKRRLASSSAQGSEEQSVKKRYVAFLFNYDRGKLKHVWNGRSLYYYFFESLSLFADLPHSFFSFLSSFAFTFIIQPILSSLMVQSSPRGAYPYKQIHRAGLTARDPW